MVVEPTALTEQERVSLVEGVHREHAPEAWRKLLAAERAAVTIDDVLTHFGYDSESSLRTALEHEFSGYDYERLIAGAKDEIAMARAKAKLPDEVWRRFNRDVS